MTMRDERLITQADYERILDLIEHTQPVAASNNLLKILKEAVKCLPEQIPGDVVTMNSTLRVRELTSGCEVDITLVYPKNADGRKRYISIVTSIGLALLGKRVGAVVAWSVPKGYNQFEILEVLFQPETVGDYSR
jgi:regulator of nucleoside diphosphate kinase